MLSTSQQSYSTPLAASILPPVDPHGRIVHSATCMRCGRPSHLSGSCPYDCQNCQEPSGHTTICPVQKLEQAFANNLSVSDESAILDESIELSLGVCSANASMMSEDPSPSSSTLEHVLRSRYDMSCDDMRMLANALSQQYSLDFPFAKTDQPSTVLTARDINQYDNMVAVATRYGDDILGGNDPELSAPDLHGQVYFEYKTLLPADMHTLYSTTAIIASANTAILDTIDASATDASLSDVQINAFNVAEGIASSLVSIRQVVEQYLCGHLEPTQDGSTQQSA